ncbi:pleckstrin homology domain-containing family O member 2 [Dendropsophus ebraccatus]|uniref:pleckstrin homology domain-containing family O member 2 n=1 Tax=Dendropsophus ebraccatus TaxID=150705 RepID=UPI003831E7C2
MEDGVKGSSAPPPESKVIHKAGWLKKASGLLGLWKDRYIQILQTQLCVFDNEDEQRCLETLELANYERCQDQRAFLKRKKHFNLIPSPGSKVQEVKFQARNAEERDVWIQALNDGINRGKNKVFDEVKVDPKCSLEHVTRDRVKVGAAKRRPPTRIHLKEVADAAADDSLRLGLEALDTGILTIVPPTPKEKDEEPKPEKEPVKIPMPPTKQNSPQTTEPSISETDSNGQAPYVPFPPSKILKENIYAREKLLSANAETDTEKQSEHGASDSPGGINGSNIVSSPPKPPPKILSEKMKIKWVGSSADMIEKEKGSKENLAEFDSDDTEISNDVNIEDKSLQDENDEESSDVDDEQHDVEDVQSDMSTEKTTEDAEEEEKTMLDEDIKIGNIQKSTSEQLLLHDTNMSPKLLIKKRNDKPTPAERRHINRKPKASSMGDLLSDSSLDFESKKDGAVVHLTKDRLNKVEMKLACGRQRAETLLQQVLNGQHRNAEEGNGLDVKSATILNEVMRDLQEASEALKEIKGPKNTMPEGVTDTQNEKQKDLVALHRRTVHF